MEDEGDTGSGAAQALAEVLGAAAGSGLAAAATAMDPHAMTAGAAAGQMAVGRLAGAALEARHRRAERMTDFAIERSGRDVEGFVRTVLGNDQLLELFAVAVEAAMQAMGDAKLRTLGALVADGVLADDSTRISVDYLLARIWRDLERPHLQVLEHIAEAQPKIRVLTMQALRGQEKSLQDIDVGLPSLAEGMESLVAVLRQHGLVEATIVDWKGWQDFIARAVSDGPMTGPPEDSIKVTTLGHLVLERYRKA